MTSYGAGDSVIPNQSKTAKSSVFGLTAATESLHQPRDLLITLIEHVMMELYWYIQCESKKIPPTVF